MLTKKQQIPLIHEPNYNAENFPHNTLSWLAEIQLQVRVSIKLHFALQELCKTRVRHFNTLKPDANT